MACSSIAEVVVISLVLNGGWGNEGKVNRMGEENLKNLHMENPKSYEKTFLYLDESAARARHRWLH